MAKLGFGLLYAALGVALILIMHILNPGADIFTVFLLGILVALSCAGTHVMLVLRQKVRLQEVKILGLRRDLSDVAARTESLQNSLKDIDETGDGTRMDALFSEVKILQNVIDRIVQGGKNAATKTETNVDVPVGSMNDREIMNMVNEAVKGDRIEVFLQPIVSLPQRKLRFYEMFTRIRTPDGHYLTPERFVKLAEEGGVIPNVDNLQLLRCIQMIRDTEKRHSTLRFFCNISSNTLRDTGFMTELVQFLAQNSQLAPKLIFELAQEDLATMSADLVPVLDGLGRIGCRFSMDRVYSLDFPMAALTARKIRTVKIDTDVLLTEFHTQGGDMRLRELKNGLDRNGIDMIVSKIESEAQLRELLDLNIDFGQGYLFGEPRANWPLS